MAVELQAKIGADSSELVRETKKATSAWKSFTGNLKKEGSSAAKSFDGITKGAKNLGTALKTTGAALRKLDFKGVGTGLKSLAAGVGQAAKGFLSLGASVAKIGFSVISAGAKAALGAVKGLAIGVVALGAALTGIGIKSVLEFGKFEKAFSQVRTLIDEGKVDVEALEAGVRGLATTFGVDLKQATLAAYQAISAGVEPAQVVEFLGTAFKGALAGAADVAEVTKLITGALNAFNKPVSEAAKVSDIFFTTVAKGVTTIPELAASFGQVSGIAAAAGVEIEEVAASFAALTANSVNTAEAATQIKAAIVGVINPSKAAGVALKGLGIDAKLLREQGLEEVFKRLRAATGGATDQLAKFLPNVRALQGAAILAGGGFDKFNKVLKQTREGVGATDLAFTKVEKNISVAFGKLQASVTDLFVSLGKVIAPLVQSAANNLSNFVNGTRADFDALSNAFAKRFGPAVSKFFGDLTKSSGKSGSVVSSALKKIGDGLKFLGKVIQANGSLIATLVAAFQALGKTVRFVANLIKAGLGAALTAIGTAATALLGVLAALAKAVGLSGLADDLQDGTDAAKLFTKSVGSDTLDALKDMKDEIASFDDVGKTFDSVKASSLGLAQSFNSAGNAANLLADDVNKARAKAEELKKEQKELGTATKKAATATKLSAASTTELAAAAAKGVVSIDQATKALQGMKVAVQGVGVVAIQTKASLLVFSEAAKSTSIGVEDLSRNVSAAFRVIDSTFVGQFRSSAEELVAQFGRGEIASKTFLASINDLSSIQGTFVDSSPLDRFVIAAGESSIAIESFKGTTLDALRTVGNLLKGEFRKSADVLIDRFAKAEINSRKFAAEINKLAAQQLGLDATFVSVDKFAEDLKRLAAEARNAQAQLGTGLRDSVAKAKEEFDAGKISLDQYLDSLLETGEQLRELKGLTEDQLVSFNKLRSANKGVADQVRDLAKSLDSSLKPAFNTLLKAFRAGRVNAEQLGVGLGRLAIKQKELGTATKETSEALRDQGAALDETANKQREFFDTLAKAEEAFRKSNEVAVRYRTEGIEKLNPKIDELKRRTTDAGRALVTQLVKGFEQGELSGKDLRAELQKIADQLKKTEEQAARTGKAVSGSISAFGGKAGGIGFGKGSLGGFGIQGRVTGSSNFTSQLESQLGAALGLKPKALRSRAARSGGIEALASEVGLNRQAFVDGGKVSQTGPAKVEAGEFVLSRRGLSDLGTVFAELLNKGGAKTGGLSMTNNFNVQAPEADRFGTRDLAFALKPALMQVAGLAAARNPIT